MSRNIKPGYQVHVRSWENDGDNYKTEILTGLSEDEAKFYVLLAKAFESRYKKRSDDLPYTITGNDENETVELANLWRYAAEKYPAVAAKLWGEEDEFPTEEQIDLYDEYCSLRYNDPYKDDAKFENLGAVEGFMDFFNDLMSNLLSSPSETYWDFNNFFRVCESVQVYYLPGSIENVTNQFIDKEGNLI
ncbi:hypothetical protein [Xanthomonas phage BUDD]|nr:hypothetical protein [Xanthomonas phage BUDD]